MNVWAFVTDNNYAPVENEEVILYTVVDGVETVYGSSVTDSMGIAYLSYVGSGVGNIGLKAKCGSLVSETYSIIDAIFNDKVLSDTTSLYYYNPSYASIQYSDGKIVVTELVLNANGYVDVRSLTETIKGKSVRFSCDVEPTNCEVRLEVFGTSSANRYTDWVSTASHLETDAYTIPSNTTTGFFRISVRSNPVGSSFAFKNFTVWIED